MQTKSDKQIYRQTNGTTHNQIDQQTDGRNVGKMSCEKQIQMHRQIGRHR